MSATLLAPHNDDETLFASFLVQKFRPRVIVCLRSQVQADRYGILAETREKETVAACRELGLTKRDVVQLPHLDRKPNWTLLRRSLLEVVPTSGPVFAPAWEDGGHEHHNEVATMARELFGERVLAYLTYRRGFGKTTSEREVEPVPAWIVSKLRALSCYRSQIEEPSCRPWFLGDVREYLA